MYKLVIEDDEGKTTVVPIIRDEITIGRKEGNTIRLTERNVSRRHAKLVKDGDELHIEDVASSYGTRHNGEKISSRISFREGDVVMIGDYRLSVQIDRAAARRAQAPPSVDDGATAVGIQAMDDEDEIPIPEAGKLVVISSNYAGREYRLTRTEMVIGRTEGDIQIDHRSISRNHAKILREDVRYKIVDLRSSNGVRVNGEEYRSVHLKRGDVIELGHVRFRYVEPGEVFHFVPDRNTYSEPPVSPAAQDKGLGKVVAVAGILGVFVILLGVVAFLLLNQDEPAEKPPITSENMDKPAAGANLATDAKADAFLIEANKAIESEDWKGAITLLEVAKGKDPGNASVRDKLSQAQRELPLKAHYEAGKKALDAEKYQEALDAFDQLPEDTNLSIYSNRVQNKGLREQAVGGLIDTRLTSARKDLKAKDWLAAKRNAEDVLDIDADNKDANDIHERAARELRKEGRADLAKRESRKNDRKNTKTENGGSDKGTAVASNDKPKKTTPPKTNDKPAKLSKEEKAYQMKDLLAKAFKANQTGQYQKALSYLSQARKCCGGSGRMVYIEGKAYEGLGNKARAIQIYNNWLSRNGGARTAPGMRKKILNLGGTPVN